MEKKLKLGLPLFSTPAQDPPPQRIKLEVVIIEMKK
jgi:hypothetical protein